METQWPVALLMVCLLLVGPIGNGPSHTHVFARGLNRSAALWNGARDIAA